MLLAARTYPNRKQAIADTGSLPPPLFLDRRASKRSCSRIHSVQIGSDWSLQLRELITAPSCQPSPLLFDPSLGPPERALSDPRLQAPRMPGVSRCPARRSTLLSRMHSTPLPRLSTRKDPFWESLPRRQWKSGRQVCGSVWKQRCRVSMSSGCFGFPS